MTLDFLTLVDQARLVASRQVSSRELTEHSLAVIARRNPDLNAFCHVMVDEALAEADARDTTLNAGGKPIGPLHGVPIAIKDEYDIKGQITAFGTNAVSKPATQDCEAVRRLRAAGAVIVGKTVMPEFGQWPFTESTTYGYTRNPWNTAYSPAGSSGGTAAAVASGMVAAGMGGDGGGSIRLPSAWCGLFGVKVQRGRISPAPNKTLWRGLGVLGVLTRTVADSALMLDVMAGNLKTDKYQVTPWDEPMSVAMNQDPGRLRVLVTDKAPGGGPALEKQMRAALHKVADTLAGLGHSVVEGDLPQFKPGIAMIGQMAGGVVDELKHVDVRRLEARTRQALPMYRVLSPIAARAEASAEGLAKAMFTVFDDYDLVLTPVVAHPPLLVGQLDGQGIAGTIRKALPMTAFTSVWNVLGNPAASVPSGFTANGLPLAVQLVVAPGREDLIFQVAAQIEHELPWAGRTPPAK